MSETLVTRMRFAEIAGLTKNQIVNRSLRDRDFPEPVIKGKRGGRAGTRRPTLYRLTELQQWFDNLPRDENGNIIPKTPRSFNFDVLSKFNNELATKFLTGKLSKEARIKRRNGGIIYRQHIIGDQI